MVWLWKEDLFHFSRKKIGLSSMPNPISVLIEKLFITPHALNLAYQQIH